MANTIRRTTIVGIGGTAAVAAASLVGAAMAATTLTQSSITPANGSTVQDARPPITAVYSDNLDSSSTIALTKSGTTYDCPKTVSGKNISCTPSALLKAGTYSVAIHAVDAADKSATANNTSTFTVDVPTLTSESPATGASVATLPNGVISATYNEAIDNSHSTIKVQQVTDINGTPGDYTPLTGKTDFPGQSSTAPGPTGQPSNDGKTIEFTPDGQPQSSGTYEVTLDVFGVTPGGTLAPNAYNSKAESRDVYRFTIDRTQPVTPTNLNAPTVTQANQTAVPFTGSGRAGNTITVDASDGSAHVNNNSTPVAIAACGGASCPWTVTLDLHTLADTTHGTWVATAHNSAGTAVAPTQNLVKDATGPTAPTVTVSLPASSATAHVTGTESDASVDHYSVTAADSHAHTTPAVVLTRAPNGGVASNGSFAGDLDVSNLDDGSITVTVTPYDGYNNKGSAGTASATKNVGMAPLFNLSFFKLTPSGTSTFAAVQADSNHVIRPFGQVAVEFTNPIALTRTDSGLLMPKNIDAPKPYFVDNFGSGNTLSGTASIDSTDNRRMLITPPPGFTDGGYTLHVSVFEGNGVCNFNSDPAPLGTGPAGSCPTFSGFIVVPGTSTNFLFDRITPVTTSLTESISHGSIVYGQSATLSGHLVRADTGAGLAGQALTITPAFDNGSTGSAMHVTTSSTGTWSLTITPMKSARYTVSYGGDLRMQPSSASAMSHVSALVRLTGIYARNSSHATPVTISGTVGPNQAGRVVYIYLRKSPSSRFQRVATVVLNSKSAFSWTHTFPVGTYYCYATFPAQNGNTAGRSGTAHFSRS